MDTTKLKKFLPVALVVVLVVGTFSTASALLGSRSTSAQNVRPQAGPAAPQAVAARPTPASDSGCSGLSCYGDYGDFGNHVTGRRGGAGNLSGYSAVRFDVFRPEPSLTTCNRADSRDRNAMRQLGIQGGIHEDRYWHRRVAQNRNTGEVVAGVQDSLASRDNVYYNANTGATDASRPLPRDNAPTQSNPWMGPDYLGIRYCLPLSGDGLVRNQLENREPTISILSNGNPVDFTPPTEEEFPDEQERLENFKRALLGSKDLILRIEIEESTSSGAIPIRFEHLKEHVKINVGSLYDFFQYLEDVRTDSVDEERANEIWKYSTESESAIHADVRNVASSIVSTSGGTTVYRYDVPLTIKKTGVYIITVDVNYQAFVGGNTNPFTGLSGASGQLALNAISAKSVNRR